MKINGYQFGKYPPIHVTLCEDLSIQDAMDSIADDLKAFAASGQIYDTITLDITMED